MAVEEGNPDRVSGQINFEKLRLLTASITAFRRFQSSSYNILPQDELLTNLFSTRYILPEGAPQP